MVRVKAAQKQKASHEDAMRECFLEALVEFLVGDQTCSFVDKPWAKEWSKLRGCTPIQGWATEEEARAVLKEFFGW